MSVGVGLIYCSVLEDELEELAQAADVPIRLHKMPQGLHNEPLQLREQLQSAIDELDADPILGSIVLGYGLCSRGTEGVRTQRCTLVLPRAHDCITLLMGSKEKYAAYVKKHPGTYWYSPGWNRHHIPPGQDRYELLLAHYIERFGDDEAEYLMEQEQAWFKVYDRATLVHQGVGDVPGCRSCTQKCADWLGWKFDEVEGDHRLLRDLLLGPWDEERYAVMQPGETVRLVADERVVEVVRAP